jgi:hypothetical protein
MKRHVAAYLFILPITLPSTPAATIQLIPRIKVAIEHISHIRHRHFAIAVDISAHPDIGQAVIGFVELD